MADPENVAPFLEAKDVGDRVQKAGNWILQYFTKMGEGALALAQDLRESGERLSQWAASRVPTAPPRKRGAQEVADLLATLRFILRKAQSLRGQFRGPKLEVGDELIVDVIDAIRTSMQAVQSWPKDTGPEQAPEIRSWFGCRVALRTESWYRSGMI